MGLLIVTWLLFLIPHFSGHVAQQAPAAVVTFLEFLITRVFFFCGLECEYTVSSAVPVACSRNGQSGSVFVYCGEDFTGLDFSLKPDQCVIVGDGKFVEGRIAVPWRGHISFLHVVSWSTSWFLCSMFALVSSLWLVLLMCSCHFLLLIEHLACYVVFWLCVFLRSLVCSSLTCSSASVCVFMCHCHVWSICVNEDVSENRRVR